MNGHAGCGCGGACPPAASGAACSRATAPSGDGPILFLLPYPSLSGLELFCLRFAVDLQNRGIPVAVAAPEGGLIAEQCRIRELPFRSLPELRRIDPAAVKRLCDILGGCGTGPAARAVVAFRTQAMYPVHLARLMMRLHAPLFLFYRIGAGNYHRRDPLHRVLFRHVAAVVPNADHVANKIIKYWAISHDKVVCIRSGVDTDRYRPDEGRREALRASLGLPENALLIGNAGRIHPEKGSEILIDAVFGPGGASAGRSDIHLAYVGREYQPGYADHLRNRAAGLGAADRFHILPFRNDIEAVHPGFDLFALAVTSHETYAYTALEAMACGVPAIVPAIGGMSEMFADGAEGFFFRHRDTSSLRETLLRAVSLPAADRLNMGRAARERILRTAGWDAMMDRYIDLFARCRVPMSPGDVPYNVNNECR
ncbi:MAG TPA: glycosyltransferase family 4 protein [Candidatus Ozemobacteraceae bacterium]|nr:glycosyltransferase family 4 protein [Candidatus Ozemobacteraceae bacterium]